MKTYPTLIESYSAKKEWISDIHWAEIESTDRLVMLPDVGRALAKLIGVPISISKRGEYE